MVLAGALILGGCQEPGDTEMARGNVLASRGQHEEAIAAYRAAAAASPASARPLELLGHVLQDRGRAAEARDAYRRAIELSPEGAVEARLGLAKLEASEGRLDGAIAQLTAVLEAEKNNLFALLSRAQLHLRRGGREGAEAAIQDTARAMLIDRRNAVVLYTRGQAFLAAGAPDQAAEAFRLLQEARPSSPLWAYGLAKVAMARGDRASALDGLRKARERASPGSGYSTSEVRKDPAFAALRDDPDFAAAVGEP